MIFKSLQNRTEEKFHNFEWRMKLRVHQMLELESGAIAEKFKTRRREEVGQFLCIVGKQRQSP